MADYFFYGTLCHLPLLEAVIGRVPPHRPARLPGHAAHWVAGQSYPMLVPGAGEAEGLCVSGLDPAEAARLDFYEGGFARDLRDVRLVPGGQTVSAQVFLPPAGAKPGAPWTLGDWARQWGATVTAAAQDFMRDFPTGDPSRSVARYPLLLIRGGARVRAAAPKPASLRRPTGPGDVETEALRQPYAAYFAVEEFDLRHRRFDGAMSERLTRAVFISGDAAVVLPYDPVRDRVLVIEQFRAGPHARGDGQPWLIEAVAGRVDGGETPEEAALREAREEAGIEVARLLPVANYYPSPAAKAEYLYTYVGLADLPDGTGGVHGVPGEGEDIRAHVIGFERLMDLVATGEVDNAPLLILAMWLAGRREALRREAGVPAT